MKGFEPMTPPKIGMCGICRHLDRTIALTSDPPQYICQKSGEARYESDECNVEETDTRWEPITIFKQFQDSGIPGSCRFCPNHPSNGGTGICHCVAGLQTIT